MLGPFYVLGAAVLWSFAGLCTRFIPWGALSISAIRGLLAAVAIGVYTKQWFFKPTTAVLLGAFGTASTSVIFMIANKMTTAANAIVLQYTAPVFVIIITAIAYKAKPKILDIVTVITTLFGISLFFIDHLAKGSIVGDLLSLLSGLTFSIVFLANRLPGANPMQASYLGCLLNGLLFPIIFFDQSLRSPEPKIILAMLATGIFQQGLAYIFFSKEIKTTPAISASIIAMIEPIINPIWVFLYMGERPGPMAVIGTVIVILTIGVYNVISIYQKQKEETKQDERIICECPNK